jgi:hypothetical protein
VLTDAAEQMLRSEFVSRLSWARGGASLDWLVTPTTAERGGKSEPQVYHTHEVGLAGEFPPEWERVGFSDFASSAG